MIVLDTDHLSILQHHDSSHAQELRQRIGSVEDEEVVTTVRIKNLLTSPNGKIWQEWYNRLLSR